MGLKEISDTIREAANRKEQDRIAHESTLGEPNLFIPDPESEGHGLGFFKKDDDIIYVYRKYSNGYERYPVMTYSRDMVEKLYKIFNPD